MKTHMKPWICLGLALMCIAAALTACGQSPATYNAGVYTSTQKGYGGDLTVEVEFDSSSILSVTVTDQAETVGFGDQAIATLPNDILEAQSADVDAVTSATVTSDAIKAAVADCMQQAQR